MSISIQKTQAEWDEKKGMRGRNTISINGRLYDAATGLPVSELNAAQAVQAAPVKSAPKLPHKKGVVMSDVGGRRPVKPASSPVKQPAEQPKPIKTRTVHSGAHHVHKRTQKSQTLHRAALKRPSQASQANKQPVQRSQMIQKFAAQAPVAAAQPETPKAKIQQPSAQPKLQTPANIATHSRTTSHQKSEALKGKELKEHLIKEQMRHVDTIGNLDKKPSFTQRLRQKYPRTATIVTGIAALVVLGGYLTYLNLPSLSIRVAAAQAGVDATYPSYQPSGYSFAGPVAFSPGEVRVKFTSNTNDYNYSLIQRDSTWDSQAVLDNYVLKETKQYATLQERGLTIYLMNNKAAWVNGGVLYTIEGNAPLSSEQIQKIASSTI